MYVFCFVRVCARAPESIGSIVCVCVCYFSHAMWLYTFTHRDPFSSFPTHILEGSKTVCSQQQQSTQHTNILIQHHILFHRLIFIVQYTHIFFLRYLYFCCCYSFFCCWFSIFASILFRLLIVLKCVSCWFCCCCYCYYWCCWFFKCFGMCIHMSGHWVCKCACVCKMTTINFVQENRWKRQGKVKNHYPVFGYSFYLSTSISSRQTHTHTHSSDD